MSSTFRYSARSSPGRYALHEFVLAAPNELIAGGNLHLLCNSQLCLEKVVTTSDQSGITMTACAVNAQIGIADWLAKGPYREWHLQRYKCVLGKYTPKNEA